MLAKTFTTNENQIIKEAHYKTAHRLAYFYQVMLSCTDMNENYYNRPCNKQ
jgi:hypothetical protein